MWTAITAGLGGMRETEEGLRFAPRLPGRLSLLCCGVRVHGRTLRVEVTSSTATYELKSGDSLTIGHFGDSVELEAGMAVTHDIPALPPVGPRLSQPRGRQPRAASAAFGE